MHGRPSDLLTGAPWTTSPAQNRSCVAADPFNLQNGVEALLGLLQGEGNPWQLAAAAELTVHPGLEGPPKCHDLIMVMRPSWGPSKGSGCLRKTRYPRI